MAKKKPEGKTEGPWMNRIVGHGEEAPDQLLANPLNFRIHPEHQQEAVDGVISTLGLIQTVIVNRRTQRLLDGHLRVKLAMRKGVEKIPVVYVDLSEEEEKLALATFDQTTRLAVPDGETLRELLEGVQPVDPRVQAMLADLRKENHLDLPPEVREYDERHGEGVKVCRCEKCGHEHSAKNDRAFPPSPGRRMGQPKK